MRIPTGIDDEDEEEHSFNEDGKEDLSGNINRTDSCQTGGVTLSFTPQQAHIFGGQSIFLSFVNIDAPLNVDVFYYVIFKGSKLQHITSAKVLNPYTLHAVIPDHNDAELVMLSVCQVSTDNDVHPDNNVLATDSFLYISDSSQFLTQQLASNALHSANLLNLQNVYSSLLDISMQDKKSLDYKLSTSFRKLLLPANWSLVSKSRKEDERSWTLLHFCAKYNFPMLGEFLLVKPGAKEALMTLDERNQVPLDIANHMNHKKMTEVLSRIPCSEEEEGDSTNENEIKRPTVKRHKIGTTTISNEVSEDPHVIVKDLMILKELDTLAKASKDPQENGTGDLTAEHIPLSESLKKLHEINEEIRRLRSINSIESFENLENDLDECFEPEIVVKDEDTCNGSHFINKTNFERDDDVDLINIEDEKKPVTTQPHHDIYSENVTTMQPGNVTVPVDINEISVKILDKERTEIDQSNISTNENEMLVTEEIQIVDAEAMGFPLVNELKLDVDITPVVEVTPADVILAPETTGNDEPLGEGEVSDSKVDTADDNSSGDLPSQLESVTEETEEELSADGSVLSLCSKAPKGDDFAKGSDEKSLNDLPPQPPKRTGGIKRSGLKMVRPLSDSFENMRMIENQGIVDAFQSDSDNPDGFQLPRGHSLDELMKEMDDDNDTEQSAISMLSVNDNQGSQESLYSDGDVTPSLPRSSNAVSLYADPPINEKFSMGPQRSLSLKSLNDLRPSRHSTGYIQEGMVGYGKKSSLLERISFKKAKSMTSLETKGKPVKFEDHRKTIAEGMNPDLLQVTAIQDMTRIRSGSYIEPRQTSLVERKNTKSESFRSDQSQDHSDEDTDEGTSLEIGEPSVMERKGSSDEKQKRLFGILRGKPKERKGSSEKKEKNQRRDSDSKQLKKKIAAMKLDSSVASKSDSKASFFRGPSFRNYSNKSLLDSKLSEKPVLMRGSSSQGSNNLFNKRASERKSPSLSRKATSSIQEEGGSDVVDSNLLSTKSFSSSRTSLDSLYIDDDIDAAFTPWEGSEYDSDLDKNEEPETWSELVDKKVQRRMHAKDIKRQDVIYELIQTEALYVRTLQIMRKIYAEGMIRCLNYEVNIVNSMFPVLNDLIELNGTFHRAMKKEQDESINYCVESIGKVILEAFDGENGQMFKEAYGYFCSHHLEAVALYKELLKSDKRFQKFVKNCLLNERTRRLSVPECITYVTIRMTKYPLLIEAIIKATKESSPDYENLKKSLKLVKEILVAVDEDVEIHEQHKELENLKKIVDRKNIVEIKTADGKKGAAIYKTTKLFHNRSHLLYDKKVTLKSKNKLYETRMVILTEKIVFFQENGGKLVLLNVDNKLPVMFLKGVMVREVATDPKALFLMNTSKESVEIYEIGFDKAKDKLELMSKLEKYIRNCPDEEEENLTDNEEEARREEEERMSKLKDIVDQLDFANEKILQSLEEKNRIVLYLRKLIETMDDEGPVKGSPCSDLKPADVYNARTQLEDCLAKANHLLASSNSNDSAPQLPGQNNVLNNAHIPPKKADTFGGFDQRSKPVGNNINRAVSMKPIGRTSVSAESDTGTNKNRRQSQFMQVLGRTKTMESTEDLASLSSSTSSTSLGNINVPSLSQVQVYQILSERLESLVEVTNKQDAEMARMRYELQECRGSLSKSESEVGELREKLIAQQKDNEKQLRYEKENYAKLHREFKRSKEKLNQKLAEQRQQLKPASEEMIV